MPSEAWEPSVPPITALDPARQARLSRAQDDLVDAGELLAAERLLRSWIADHPDLDVHVAQLELARILFWRGQIGEARALLDRLRAQRPDDSWALSFAGQVAARAGDLAAARALFLDALAREPENHEARLFLGGDDLGDAARARRMLTHGALPPRGRIELASLCAALDFRRGRRFSSARGELTQAAFDRANLMVDAAPVGGDVEAELSLRPALARAARVVFYTSHALGDTLLGLAVVDALERLFEFRPGLRRPIELVSPYAALLEGLVEQRPSIRVQRLCDARDPDEGLIYADDLRRRAEPIFALCNSAPFVTGALAEAMRDGDEVVDLLIDRYARDLVPWQSVVPPRERIASYPARLVRFLEILLGCRLVDRPAQVQVTLPLPEAICGRRELLLRRLGLDGATYHCVIESASKRCKAFAPSVLAAFLCQLARECGEIERATGRHQRVLFSCDPWMAESFAPEIPRLPDDVRARLVTVEEDLAGMAVLLAGAATVVSTDTGLAHLAAALGRPTLIVYTMADPLLWRTGGDHVRALATPQALAAHDSCTPVNMPEWETPHPVMAGAIGPRDLIDAWRRCRDGI